MKKHFTLVFSILVSVVALDQASKLWARAHLSKYLYVSVVGEFFKLMHSENTGAFLSLGAGQGEVLRFWFFTVGVAGFLLAMLVYLLKHKEMSRFKTICLSLLVAGGFGNLIDRATRGSVTDFMIFSCGPLHTGILNVADMAITGAVLALLVESFLVKEKKS